MAVAIKKLGYENIVIYNGGLKDWLRSGLAVESIDPLPNYQSEFISAEELMEAISGAKLTNCVNSEGKALVTIIDFRSSLQLQESKGADLYQILTNCQTKTILLDDFINNQELIDSIPKEGLVVTVSETGNRDVFLIRYLSKFGYKNIVGLQFGMRAWMKKNYPHKKR